MPRAAAKETASTLAICQELPALLAEAARFVARDRAEAQMRKWLSPRDTMGRPEAVLRAMSDDARLLSADLLLSQPSASGATAFDRLARAFPGASPARAAAIAALRHARFRLLVPQHAAEDGVIVLRDVISADTLRLVGADLSAAACGIPLFARVVPLGDGLCCMAGAITPLDDEALGLARTHAAARIATVSAATRWAEAVYGRVVRYGTLEVPGLNCADDEDADCDEDDPLLDLARAWESVGETAPSAALLHRTRALTGPTCICAAVGAVAALRTAGSPSRARAFERLVLVQLETLARRNRVQAGRVTLDDIGREIAEHCAKGIYPANARAVFGNLRQRITGGTETLRPGDPALERLVQRIQALRAKTVAQGCTEQEALAAAEKVAELLDRYGLSLGDLDFRAQPCDGVGIETTRRRAAPIDECIPSIAAFFDCRVWLEHSKGEPLRYVFFGLRGDVAAARYLYELVERAFDSETAAFRAGEIYAAMVGDRRKATNSFQLGLGRGICVKLCDLRMARAAAGMSASGRDLVPMKAAMVDEELAALGLDLRTRASNRNKMVLTDAYEAGTAAGARFEYAPGITKAA